MILGRSAVVLVLACAFPGLSALGQPAANTTAPATERPAPYDDDLTRLSVILGSVQYLRSLCNTTKEDDWRLGMQQLLDAETKGEPKRRERLTAAFNRGYRSFASVYTDCTSQAIVAEERYRNEGATLATEITARFGN
jgi:uncharacterized protein (TIGR02301 family)